MDKNKPLPLGLVWSIAVMAMAGFSLTTVLGAWIAPVLYWVPALATGLVGSVLPRGGEALMRGLESRMAAGPSPRLFLTWMTGCAAVMAVAVLLLGGPHGPGTSTRFLTGLLAGLATAAIFICGLHDGLRVFTPWTEARWQGRAGPEALPARPEGALAVMALAFMVWMAPDLWFPALALTAYAAPALLLGLPARWTPGLFPGLVRLLRDWTPLAVARALLVVVLLALLFFLPVAAHDWRALLDGSAGRSAFAAALGGIDASLAGLLSLQANGVGLLALAVLALAVICGLRDGACGLRFSPGRERPPNPSGQGSEQVLPCDDDIADTAVARCLAVLSAPVFWALTGLTGVVGNRGPEGWILAGMLAGALFLEMCRGDRWSVGRVLLLGVLAGGAHVSCMAAIAVMARVREGALPAPWEAGLAMLAAYIGVLVLARCCGKGRLARHLPAVMVAGWALVLGLVPLGLGPVADGKEPWYAVACLSMAMIAVQVLADGAALAGAEARKRVRVIFGSVRERTVLEE